MFSSYFTSCHKDFDQEERTSETSYVPDRTENFKSPDDCGFIDELCYRIISCGTKPEFELTDSLVMFNTGNVTYVVYEIEVNENGKTYRFDNGEESYYVTNHSVFEGNPFASEVPLVKGAGVFFQTAASLTDEAELNQLNGVELINGEFFLLEGFQTDQENALNYYIDCEYQKSKNSELYYSYMGGDISRIWRAHDHCEKYPDCPDFHCVLEFLLNEPIEPDQKRKYKQGFVLRVIYSQLKQLLILSFLVPCIGCIGTKDLRDANRIFLQSEYFQNILDENDFWISTNRFFYKDFVKMDQFTLEKFVRTWYEGNIKIPNAFDGTFKDSITNIAYNNDSLSYYYSELNSNKYRATDLQMMAHELHNTPVNFIDNKFEWDQDSSIMLNMYSDLYQKKGTNEYYQFFAYLDCEACRGMYAAFPCQGTIALYLNGYKFEHGTFELISSERMLEIYRYILDIFDIQNAVFPPEWFNPPSDEIIQEQK